MSHSPEFINDMKTKLLAERAMLQEELNVTSTEIDGERQVKFPEYGEDEDENAVEIDEATALASVTDSNQTRLREVEAALQRIEAGKYGLTPEGEMISEERLRANPAATTIIHPGD